MNESKEKYKILAMVILLGICCFLIYYFHAILRTVGVFTHFFYIPIVLAALWWRKKGLVVAIILAALLIFSNLIFPFIGYVGFNDYFRTIMFIVIAFIVAKFK